MLDQCERAQCKDSSAAPTAHRSKRTVSPARVGAQANGPAETSASSGNGVTRRSIQGSSSARARIVTASPLRLARTVTRRPAHDTGASDQSDLPRVATAPALSRPSADSTPALIQFSASMRRNRPCVTQRAIMMRETDRLVELALVGEVAEEGDLDRLVLGQGSEQRVLAIVHKAVRCLTPGVTGFDALHQQRVTVRRGIDGLVSPAPTRPVHALGRWRHCSDAERRQTANGHLPASGE